MDHGLAEVVSIAVGEGGLPTGSLLRSASDGGHTASGGKVTTFLSQKDRCFCEELVFAASGVVARVGKQRVFFSILGFVVRKVAQSGGSSTK